MEKDFWLERWQNRKIGFHEGKPNSLLVKYVEKLALKDKDRIFIPLCGKSLDIKWLLSKGYRIVGVELAEIAIQELFIELGIKPQITQENKFKKYSGENLDIFVGSIFDLSALQLDSVNAIYDRAALVALPKEMRKQYSQHIKEISKKAPQLLVSFEYDQSKIDGPPFSVDEKEIQAHYIDSYELTLLESIDVLGGLKKVCPAKENAWLLTNKTSTSNS